MLALAVSGESAISVVRTMMGATNPLDSAPGTIRGDFALELSENIVHGRTRRRARGASWRCSSPPVLSEPDYIAKNRDGWTRTNAEYTDGAAERGWSDRPFTWGVFGVPEADLHVLGEVAGLDVIELGCGTAYFAAWLARQGARPVGVDVTPAQLDTARRMQEETGLTFPLIEANAEDVPLPGASFDLAVSEFGASLWCDPYLGSRRPQASQPRRAARLPDQQPAQHPLRGRGARFDV